MCKKLIIVLVLSLLLISSAGAKTIIWDFEKGYGHGFLFQSTYGPGNALDDPDTAGDESLTGIGQSPSLPEAGVAWTVGQPNQFDGLKPAVAAGARVDGSGLLDYSLGEEVIPAASGTLNTFNLNQNGDSLNTPENDQIASSPVVQLEEGAVLRVWYWGGGNGTHAPQYDTDPLMWYTDGSSGIAVVSAEDYSLLASVHTPNQGALGEVVLDLSAFAGEKILIDVVDAFDGSSGWLAIEAIEISNRQQGPDIPPMVAHWPLDYGVGGIVHDVVGGNNGTVVGLDSSAWISAKLNGGIRFDNTDGHHIEVPHSDALDFGDEDFTISMLVRYQMDPSGQTDRWIIKGTHASPGSGSRYELFYTGSEVRFAIDNGPADVKSRIQVAQEPFLTGDWVHVVAVRDAVNDQLSIYADGVKLDATGDPGVDTSGDISSGEALWIGESTDETGTAMMGDIDDVRIFAQVLTEDDIAAIYELYEQPPFEVAGDLLVDVSAADPSAGTITWANNGTLGDFNFVTTIPGTSSDNLGTGGLGTDLTLEEFEGVPVVHVMSNAARLAAYVGPQSVPGIEGDGDRTIEVWVADNDDLPRSQVIISWAYRGGPPGSAMALSYGTRTTFGAAIHWDDPFDCAWGNNFDAGGDELPDELPETGKLHHLVYTYENNTVKLYRDGQLVVTRITGQFPLGTGTPAPLNTHAGQTINLFVQNLNNTGGLSNNSLPDSLLVNSIRVHDGVLTEEQVLNNYLYGPAR